ncbi:MAG TPA: hypothetical protein VGD40_13320 [Chryseosolibacter sp.]
MRCLMLLLLGINGSLAAQPYASERTILDRIIYIYNLKSVVNENAWPGFTAEAFDVPLVYYADSACYVANPTQRFIDTYKPTLLSKASGLTIFKAPLLDRVPFHMETGMTFGDDATAYNHESPFMNCSSFEITSKTVPDVKGTEQWATMVIHEYFHGFQFKHHQFFEFFKQHILTKISEDSLRKVYKSISWYKESVDRENDFLLSALNANTSAERKKDITKFFEYRKERRKRMAQEMKLDITTVERAYEKMEGTARYVEYSLYDKFAQTSPDTTLSLSDSAYNEYSHFKNHTLAKDDWLYLTAKTTYFYATGFNMVRLLEKTRVDYRHQLFTRGDLALEDLLER